MVNEMKQDVNTLVSVRQAIDSSIQSLGGPIHKTIVWHMNNRGIFTDTGKIDLESFYSNLKELVGPGADMIMEDAWHQLNRKGSGKGLHGSVMDNLKKMLESEDGK